jgi:hypothetical protein
MDWALPIAPAGMISVSCVPFAETPLTTCVPRSVVVTLGREGGVRLGVSLPAAGAPVEFGNLDWRAVIVEESST